MPPLSRLPVRCVPFARAVARRGHCFLMPLAITARHPPATAAVRHRGRARHAEHMHGMARQSTPPSRLGACAAHGRRCTPLTALPLRPVRPRAGWDRARDPSSQARECAGFQEDRSEGCGGGSERSVVAGDSAAGWSPGRAGGLSKTRFLALTRRWGLSLWREFLMRKCSAAGSWAPRCLSVGSTAATSVSVRGPGVRGRAGARASVGEPPVGEGRGRRHGGRGREPFLRHGRAAAGACGLFSCDAIHNSNASLSIPTVINGNARRAVSCSERVQHFGEKYAFWTV
jgi:hypothetical protein